MRMLSVKHDTSKTNYLAAAKSSQYDALQRQIAALTNHWMDHTAQIRPSRIIPELCNYIDETGFEHLRCDEENLFSTKSDFYLGKIIGYVIEIQDEEGDNLSTKRKEIENILRQFFTLMHRNKSHDSVNLGQINNPKEQGASQEQSSAEKTDIKWWLKFIDFFSKK